MLYIMSGGGGGQEDGPELPVPSPSPAQRPSTPAHAHEELGYYGYHSHLVSIYRISVRKAQKQHARHRDTGVCYKMSIKII